MSSMKNGFSTLNRWLGKKNKDKTATPNGKLSKSSTNLSLSVSTTNINDTSQLEYNRITPLPAATSNAPFEQTFRITVQLPKDQLYVARLGARVPLSKLLTLVCENKSLDAEKYEFRNPVDPSQVYSCDLTIGAVGLSEIRLCQKSESYDSFNTDEVIKLHRTPIIRDSLSSSEFSSRNSKHTTKTTSPYSSSNSLNSMDSTGMNYTRTPVTPPATLNTAVTTPSKLTAPPRKKRAAPRPPSQMVIPEKSALVIENGVDSLERSTIKDVDNNIARKDYYMSTPNLSTTTSVTATTMTTSLTSTEKPLSNGIHCNGNAQLNGNIASNGLQNAETEEHNSLNFTVEEKNARNLYAGSVQNLTDTTLPEPSPRKRLVQVKKKTAAPVPPNGSGIAEDNISLASTNMSTPPNTPLTPLSPLTPLTPASPFKDTSPTSFTQQHTTNNFLANESRESPKPQTRECSKTPLQSSTPLLNGNSDQSMTATPAATAVIEETVVKPVPTPVPRGTTTTLLNANANSPLASTNVSKVMLNRTPTPEPRSLSCEPPELTELNNVILSCEDDDNISKQADSGIGEPVPSPIPDSLPSEGSTHECKSTFESSSDDDDMVKIYNFKLGKTLVKTGTASLTEQSVTTLEDLRLLNSAQPNSGEVTPATLTAEATPSIASDTSSWNFAIPISPPANFADVKFVEQLEAEQKSTDTPITPKIKERPMLNFEALAAENNAKTKDVADHKAANVKAELQLEQRDYARQTTTATPSPCTPLHEIVDELAAIIHEKGGVDSLIKKSENKIEIEAAKPNTLSNFSIATIGEQCNASNIRTSEEVQVNGINSSGATTPETMPDEEKLYRKRVTNNLPKQRRSITRADSFHTTAITPLATPKDTELAQDASLNGLNSRSASYLSLTKLEGNSSSALNRRRSSSELSIGESPSLQSLEIIKTILNSRKNSLATSSDGETTVASSKPTELNAANTNVWESKPKSNVETEVQKTAPAIAIAIASQTAEQTETAKIESKSTAAEELPKIYRYSGPPSINFSTWSERPKAQVAIKNEGDYIFGGKNAQNAAVKPAQAQSQSMPRAYRATMPANAFNNESTQQQPQQQQHVEQHNVVMNVTLKTAPPAVAPKPLASPTSRMGIPEKEFHVPITVKPLKDVTIESVELKRMQQNTQQPQQQTNAFNGELLNANAKRANIQTSTLPRTLTAVNNRFSMPAAATLPGSGLLRTTSITQLEASKPKSMPLETTPVSAAAAAPFGQNTLRKTGLKEKILAKEEQEKKAVINASSKVANQAAQKSSNISQVVNGANYQHNNNNNNNTATLSNGFNSATNSNASQNKTNTKTLQSAKLELKLQKSTHVYAQAAPHHFTTTHSASSRQLSPKSAPVIMPPPVAPPPPMAPMLRATKTAPTPTTASVDTRDQLLDAIRNFQRAELKRT